MILLSIPFNKLPCNTPRSRSRGKSTSGRIEEFGSENGNTNTDGRSSSLSTVHSAGNSRDNTPTPSNRKTSPGTTSSHGEIIFVHYLRTEVRGDFNIHGTK